MNKFINKLEFMQYRIDDEKEAEKGGETSGARPRIQLSRLDGAVIYRRNPLCDPLEPGGSPCQMIFLP